MPARKQALADFYFGPIWKAHRDTANATLYDNDNVLLLHPASGTPGFALAGLSRPPPGQPAAAPGFVVITVYAFAQPVRDDFVRWFATTLRPLLTRTGAAPIAELVSDPSENTFPRLPVREGEHVFAWVAQFPSRRAYDDHLARLAADAMWSGTWFAALHKQLARPPERLMLEPTPRSLIGHADRAAPIAR
jgi:hypothetical protein